MKNKKYKALEDDWSRKSHEEFVIFYSICGEGDQAFFDAPHNKRKTDDYARLMYIALVFGFNKLALQIIAKAKDTDNVLRCLDTVSKDAPTIMKWFDDFVEDIPIPEFKKIAADTWEAAKKKINGDDFDIKYFLELD